MRKATVPGTRASMPTCNNLTVASHTTCSYVPRLGESQDAPHVSGIRRHRSSRLQFAIAVVQARVAARENEVRW